MIYIDIHRQRLSKNWANICRFVLSPWENYRELEPYCKLFLVLISSP